MRTVDLIQRKRDGGELSPEEISYLIDGYTRGDIPDYQMSAFLMAVYFSQMTDREVSRLTESMMRSGETLDLSDIPGVKVDKHSTGGVGDKTTLIVAPLAAAAGVIVPTMGGRGLGHTGGTVDKLESIPGMRTNLTIEEFRNQLATVGLCFMSQTGELAPADGRLYSLRDVTATVESIPLIASSIMCKKLAEGVDALVLDVKVGNGAFMKKQVDARRLAQMMVGIGRRMDKRVQALLTDMNQPLGYAVGNALEVMEASQTLQNAGPADLTRLSIELAARMIFVAKIEPSLEEARRLAEKKLVDGSGYQKFKQAVQAQGGNPVALDKFELLPNATGMREVTSPRGGYVSVINAQDIGLASNLIGAGRDRKEDSVDPAVGVILEVKVGEKVEAGSVLCRLYYTKEDHVEEAADMVEDAFRISAQKPDDRELILEVVSYAPALMQRFTGLLGLVVILAVAWLFSAHKRAIKLRIVLWGVGLQVAFALLVLKTDFGKIFQAIGAGVNAMLNYAEAGSNFVFGPLGIKSGPFGVVFAFQVLPIIIFIASFFSILYYLGVMQWVVKGMAVVMQKVMGASGAESLNVAASIFMGQTEAPLTIKPFIAGMTRSELFTIMTSGMAHVSGAVMAAYVKIAGVSIEHLLTAVIMTAPATIMLAKIFYPEVDHPATAGKVEVKIEKTAVNVIDAAAQGAGDGLHLALNIGAMLIAFLALIAMLNGILGWVHALPGLGWLPPSMQKIFAVVFAPLAWLMGVPWKDAPIIGNLLGTRLVLNEFVAFLELAPLKPQLDPRSFTIATYALCGFANFSSIAIQIGGIGALAPNRKSDLARLGLKAVAAGSMANFMSACIAGMLL